MNSFVSSMKRVLDSGVRGLDGLVGMTVQAAGLDRGDERRSASEARALVVVRRYTALSFAGGLIPFSYLDLVAISSAQLGMAAEVARIYGVPFERDRMKWFVSALLGSVVPQGLTAGVAGSAIKSIPAVGQLAGMVMMPAFSGSFAYALGKVLIEHFEAGGTLLDLDPAAMRAHFIDRFQTHAAADTAAPAATEGAPAPAAEAPPVASADAPAGATEAGAMETGATQHPSAPAPVAPALLRWLRLSSAGGAGQAAGQAAGTVIVAMVFHVSAHGNAESIALGALYAAAAVAGMASLVNLLRQRMG